MKFMIVIVASLASAGLVLPTVTQGQTGGSATQLASATPSKTDMLRA